ncbi:MAG: hypothetical protein ACREP9_08455 [Candidatus Dormibacteraceae bacterium]
MGSKWNGFLPQNDVIKIHWAVMEACQSEGTAKALSALLAKVKRFEMAESKEETEEDSWQAEEAGPPDPKS